MPAAASLKIASELSVQNCWVIFEDGVRTLKGQLTAWLSALAVNLDPQNSDNRTVLNWVPVAQCRVDTLPTLKANEVFNDANETGVLLYRTCKAAQFAESQGRITGAQAAAILADFNTIWT